MFIRDNTWMKSRLVFLHSHITIKGRAVLVCDIPLYSLVFYCFRLFIADVDEIMQEERVVFKYTII